MCQLCDSNQKVQENARKNFIGIAERLEGLAMSMRHMAVGSIKPHTEDSRHVGTAAVNLIRDLTAEWL
jgi:hypothetical protein